MRTRFLLPAAAVALLVLSCKSASEPDTHLGGHLIVVAQTPPPAPVPVLLYTSDPFAKNADPILITPATGSGSQLTFEFPPSVQPGDYYVVAWLDTGLDGQIDTGDYLGWYNGGKTAGGAPLAAPVHKSKGQDVSVTIQVSIAP